MTVAQRWIEVLRRDPLVVSCWVAVGLMVLGFSATVLGWAGAAATLAVPVQVPYLVSGGLGGLALVITGAAVLDVQVGRRVAARERIELESVLADTRALVEALESSQDTGSALRVRTDPK